MRDAYRSLTFCMTPPLSLLQPVVGWLVGCWDEEDWIFCGAVAAVQTREQVIDPLDLLCLVTTVLLRYVCHSYREYCTVVPFLHLPLRLSFISLVE